MTPNKLYLLLSIITLSHALECGINLQEKEKITEIITKCIQSNRTLEDLWDLAPISSESDSEEDTTIDSKILDSFRTKREVSNETENCVLQCLFESLELTDPVGYPERGKMIDALVKHETNREFKDFLQDTTDNCFQEMDVEDTMDPCAYSLKLVTCLGDKGKKNCSDWPIGDLFFFKSNLE